MATVDEYLQTWKLKLSTTKTVSAAFHPSNKEAKRELKVNFNNETLTFCSDPKYLSNVGQVARESPTHQVSGADVQAPWHGILETVWLHCD